MTPDLPGDDDITSVEDFERSLGDLLAAAGRSSVDPRGSWVFRSGDGVPDWEAMIVELEKPDGAE